MIGAYTRFGSAPPTIWVISRPHDNTRCVAFRSGGLAAFSLRLKRSTRRSSLVCSITALSEWHFGEIASCHETMAEAISLAKELNDMHGLANAIFNSGVLAHFERNVSEVERSGIGCHRTVNAPQSSILADYRIHTSRLGAQRFG